VPGLEDLEVVLVCFDPFPSVARFVGRNRLRLAVLLDHRHALARALPCPNLPYTYVLDPDGGIAVAQPGEVEWLADSTRTTLRQVLDGKRDSEHEAL
jgi:peroxiredoxin